MANNFQNGPGGRLQKEEEKNVNFGFMRPEVSPLNQQQFMQVARGQITPQQTGVNAPVVFGQKPGSIGEKIGQALTLGKKPYPGQGFQFTPSETAKQTAIDLATGEAIGRAVKAAAPYVKPAMNKAIQYITTQTPLRDAYKLNPFAFKANPEAYYRGIGEDGLKDALESGVFRSPTMRESYKGKYKTPEIYWADADNFNVAENMSIRTDGGIINGKRVIAEYPKVDNIKIKHRGSDNQMIDNYASQFELPASQGRILMQDWLQGYRPVKFK